MQEGITIKPLRLIIFLILQHLTIESFAALVRTGSVRRVLLTPYPAVDGGGWFLDVDHNDHGQTHQIHTQRGRVRVFKAADAAIRTLHDCDYAGPLAVVMKPQGF